MLRFALFLTLLLPAAGAYARGDEGPDGGDFVSAIFRARARDILNALKTVPNDAGLLTPVQLDQLARSIDLTPVDPVVGPLFDEQGFEKDALTVADPHSPTGKAVHVDTARWRQMIAAKEPIEFLVFHELLWTIGVDDTNNFLSSRLAMAPQAKDQFAGTSWAVSTLVDGIVATARISFDLSGGFERVGLVAEEGDPASARGLRQAGRYIVESGRVLLDASASSCPLDAAQLGLPRFSPSLGFDGRQLTLSAADGTSTLRLPPEVGAVSPSFMRWGCLSGMGTFTAYNTAGVPTAPPVPLLTKSLKAVTAAQSYQAIAYSYATGASGTSWNYPRPDQAALAATRLCGRADCQVVTWAGNQCAAFASNDAKRTGWWADDPARATAEKVALANCNGSAGGCRLVTSVCQQP